jgi:tetratricopeptide (TPR) repeat protein
VTKLSITTLCAAALACAAPPYPLFAEPSKPANGEEILAGIKNSPGDREALLRAVEFAPDSPAAAAALEASAKRLLKKDQADYAGYLALCRSLRASGRAQDAVSNCRRALELEPTVYPVYRELGLSYAAAGNPRKAAETLEQGIELSSSNYKAYYALAKVLETRGDADRAAPYYRKGLALTGRDRGQDAAYYGALIKAGLRRTGAAAKKAKPARQPAAAAAPKAARPPAKQGTAECLAKFKEALLKEELNSALAQSDACLKLSPADPALAAERAPLLVRLGRYEDGVKEYGRAADLYAGNGRMAAFCRIKSAETWTKLGDTGKAVEQYRLALAANPADLNAMKGLAAALEARSDLGGALETYTAILKLNPSDEKARTRQEELRTGLLTDAQMLEEMRLRGAVDQAKTALLPADVALFKAMKAAELSGAVDYLKEKAPSAKGLTVRKKDQDGPRLALTAAGYKAYIFHATKDAVKFFETKGIGLREVFKLRDLAGAPVFDAAGRLTPEGDEARKKAAAGEKTWLLPYEPVPQSPLAVKTVREIEEAKKNGYAEIEEPEYLWLLKATDCPEDVMQDAPIKLLILNDGVRRRYLLCWAETGLCMNGVNNKLPPYISRYRNGDTEISDSKTSTAFFGTGAARKMRFCEKGRIWSGELK